MLQSGIEKRGRYSINSHSIAQNQEFIFKVGLSYSLIEIHICLFTNRVEDCEIRNRSKDVGSATADWFSELLSSSPWFKDVVPNVRDIWPTAIKAI
jgi:hypothetical protein